MGSGAWDLPVYDLGVNVLGLNFWCLIVFDSSCLSTRCWLFGGGVDRLHIFGLRLFSVLPVRQPTLRPSAGRPAARSLGGSPKRILAGSPLGNLAPRRIPQRETPR